MIPQHHPPNRSQSFRHRPRPNALLGDGVTRRGANAAHLNDTDVDSTPERRRSTPTIHRRASLCRNGARVEPRIDVWPEAKPMSEAEERFLQLPDFADYTRIRQFNIDAKGAVIHRGDSFRRKRNKNHQQQPEITSQQQIGTGSGNSITAAESASLEQQQDEITGGGSSTRTSVSSSSAYGSTVPSSMALKESAVQNERQKQALPTIERGGGATDGPSSCSYKICVLGHVGSGKSSLIEQFVSSSASSSYPDSDENGQPDGQMSPTESTVSVNIGGHECELQFFERDLGDEQTADHNNIVPHFVLADAPQFHAFLLVYSIDRKQSFRVAVRILEQLRRVYHSPVPVILVGNKADLERKRAVMEAEVRNAVLTYDISHFEISVALNHDVDDLLVGIVAQVKESFRMDISDLHQTSKNSLNRQMNKGSKDSEDFHAAIRRFSQRKKRQMGVVEMDVENGKCMNFFEKLRKWRKGTSNC